MDVIKMDKRYKYNNLRIDINKLTPNSIIEINCNYYEMKRLRSSIKFKQYGCITRYINDCLYIFKVIVK